jgi:hypothetical protein
MIPFGLFTIVAGGGAWYWLVTVAIPHNLGLAEPKGWLIFILIGVLGPILGFAGIIQAVKKLLNPDPEDLVITMTVRKHPDGRIEILTQPGECPPQKDNLN